MFEGEPRSKTRSSDESVCLKGKMIIKEEQFYEMFEQLKNTVSSYK